MQNEFAGSCLDEIAQAFRAEKRLLVITVVFLISCFLYTSSSRADYPGSVVISGTLYNGAEVTGTVANGSEEYVTPSGIAVFENSQVLWGQNLGNLSAIGTWDGGLNVTLTNTTHSIQIPQVIVYYSSSVPSADMEGYDGVNRSPICNSAFGTSGTSYVQAYNGITATSPYVFTFGDGLPCYRYQAGENPVQIHAEAGWPPSDVYTFPSSIYVDGQLMTTYEFSEGINNGYWSQAVYLGAGGQASGQYAVLETYLSGDDPTGDIWGAIGSMSYYDEWNPESNIFTPQAGLGISTSAPSSSPKYGPPAIAWDGIFLPFSYSDTAGNDVYFDVATSSQIIIDSNHVVTANQPYTTMTGSYDPTSQAFTNLTGICATDGTNLLGLPPGLTIITWGSPGLIVESSNADFIEPDYILYRSDGTVVCKYTTSLNGGTFFDFNQTSDPEFAYTGVEMVMDFTNGSGTSPNVPSMFTLPSVIYIDGVEFDLQPNTESWQGSSVIFDFSYIDQDGDNIDAQTIKSVGGPVVMMEGQFNGQPDGVNTIFGNINPDDTFIIRQGKVYLTTGTPSSSTTPAQGPSMITWNGLSLSFLNTGSDGGDVYLNQQQGWVEIMPASSSTSCAVVASSYSNGVVDGTYNPVTNQFSFPFGSTQNIAAQDAFGNLLGTAPGLQIQTGPQDTLNVTLPSGGILSPDYTFQYADGSYGAKFISIPQNSLIVINSQNLGSSPVYQSSLLLANPVDLRGNVWPSSNMYPANLYVNGAYTTLDQSTLVDNGTSGLVSYHVQPSIGAQSAGLVAINWTWPQNSVFTAAVSGSTAAFSSFTGVWDGNFFTGLPAGLVISTSPPPTTPSNGPGEISWNGVDLLFNPLASSVTASNPTGADIYQDSAGLGLTISIDGDNDVTVTGANGIVYTGTYNPATKTFSFSGNAPLGSITAVNGASGGPGGGPGISGPVTSGTEIAGNLDIDGNYLTMGTWFTSGTTPVNALAVSYIDNQGANPGLIRFAATRPQVDWSWSEALSSSSNGQAIMMEVDPMHRLILHDTTSQNAAAVTLDPGGVSRFKYGILVAPQGDISMGPFMSGTSP